jgi:putative flippase GtrA
MRGLPVAQLGRFAVVGVSNTLLSIAADAVLRSAGIPATAAAALAFAAGAANGYWWNGRWTFGDGDRGRSPVRYGLIQVAGAGLTALLAAAGSASGLPAAGAFVVALAVVTPSAFFANRAWAFPAPGRIR